jgi:methionyl-tRNA formyltransferase
LNTVFFGTPSVAVPFLERLHGISQVRGVVTSPDKPAGRGYDVQPTPVKSAAQRLGLPVHQPALLKGFSLEEMGPLDLGIVVAYGKLIPSSVFNVPRHGLVNVHFSLLPKYRGAGPVQWALINGEKETGVSLFRIEAGMDTGPVYLQRPETVRPEDDTRSLRDRLSVAGLELMEELVRKIDGLSPHPQEGAPSAAPLLRKEDGRLKWDALSAEAAAGLVRGTSEWPGAFTLYKGKTVKVKSALPRPDGQGRPGAVLGLEKEGLLVQCLSGKLVVRKLQPEGKREMDAADFWNGFRLQPGDRFE